MCLEKVLGGLHLSGGFRSNQRLFTIAAIVAPAMIGAVITHAIGLAKLRVKGMPVRFGTNNWGFSGL
jgi:hypothetical protein